MNPIKKNRQTWYQICLALLVSISLIACGGESSSNNDDNDSDEDTTSEIIENDTSDRSRVVQTPSGAVTIEPGSAGADSVVVNVPDGRTFTNTCDGGPASIIVNGFEVDVCE